MSTETIIESDIDTVKLPDLEDISPPDGQSHYARKKELAIPGETITALCGKRWIPNIRNPEQAALKPLCPKCSELMQLLRGMDA